jgi:glutamate dehydrogenase
MLGKSLAYLQHHQRRIVVSAIAKKKIQSTKKSSVTIQEKSAEKKKVEVKKNAFAQAYMTPLRHVDKDIINEELLNSVVAYQEKMSDKRKPGQTVIDVCNPTKSAQGWFGVHTVINIVAEDMVFFIDSVTAYIAEKSYLIEQIWHPRIYKKSSKGKTEYLDKATAQAEQISGQMHMFIQLNRRLTEVQMAAVRKDLFDVITDTGMATRDWKKTKQLLNAQKNLIAKLPKQDERQFNEYKEFLQYIHDDNFTLLGAREFLVKKSGNKESLVSLKGSGLGLYSEERHSEFLDSVDQVRFVKNLEARKNFPQVFITKLMRKSDVHRRVPVDSVVVRHFDKKGSLTGETHFIGLFTSVTYSRGISTVPYLWYKVEQMMARAGFESGEHNGRALRHILEKYPRDELFQITDDKLYRTCMDILKLQERPRIALFVRPDIFGRTVSCLIYIPRDRYDTRLRIRFSMILEEEMCAQFVGFQSTVDDSPLVRASFTLAYTDDKQAKYDIEKIESRLQQEGQNWGERLNDTLVEMLENEDEAADTAYRYADAFPVSYQEAYQTRQAAHDIEKVEIVLKNDKLDVDLYRPHGSGNNQVSLKIYSPNRAVPLSDVLPILENMGLKVEAEYPHEVWPKDAKHPIWIQDFDAEIVGIVEDSITKNSIQTVRKNFEECFKGIWAGIIENDSLNRLVLLAGMNWRDIVIIRSYVRYMRQTKIPFSLPYMEQAATDYPAISRLMIEYFYTKFSPDRPAQKISNLCDEIETKIEQELQSVSSLDQDRVLRAVLSTMKASLRTNFFQMDVEGNPKSWVSIKMNSKKIPNLPEPYPYREIFVYSPRVEGVHLRGGKIARGGLRWSDRHEDFRVEVLGLMKAQQVKNSVIVPMGAKGGFVVKVPPKTGGRTAYQAEGIACYQTFIRGLLDITDNRMGQKIIPPHSVVRHDEDDPYLVVAADKGTATFSDIANSISQDYGFWLDDAFASGGSVGYDHKKMGITARGAWESVKRHFRELNHDTQTREFDVVGIGDMGGDVFGNGLLQSKKIRLIGAFNHMHIFCDPDPDSAISYKERARLFKAAKGWGDYDVSKLSKGGQIYLRSEKYLKLTPEIQKRFDLDTETISPSELIKAIMKSRTDLLFFGGIGTYIKSTLETNIEAGDRSNDSLRVDASEIRAKVIGEGANLAVTQRGRIEYAQKGGHLNTDFIDNSAGVDTSDHEVNIKILLSEVVRDPKHKLNQATRNKLLTEMTDDIAALVLQDNYFQTQALSLLEMQAADLLPEHADFIRSMERTGALNRKVEFLPNDEEIEDRLRIRKGLTRPELSLLVSYGKLAYTNALLSSSLPDDPAMLDWVENYFPDRLKKKYGKEILSHQLRREIIAMAVSNAVINRLGPTFVRKVVERTGADISNVTNAYLIVRDAFGLRKIWDSIEALDNKIPASIQLKAMIKTVKLSERETYWILTRMGRQADRAKDGDIFAKAVAELKKNILQVVPDDIKANLDMRTKEWISNGVPKDLAEQISLLPLIGAAFDLVKIGEAEKVDINKTAQVYFAIGSKFHFERLRIKAKNMEGDNPDLALAASGIVDSLNIVQSDMTARVIRDCGKKSIDADIAKNWIDKHCTGAHRVLETISQMEKSGTTDFATLVVIEQQLRGLC